MKAKFTKRFFAFLIDIIIVSLIFTSLNMLIPEKKNVVVLESELTNLRSDYMTDEIDTSVYVNRYASIKRSLDKEYLPNNILNIIIILGYFVLLPYYWDGKTIGKKVFKLKIVKENVKEKVSLNDYLLRSLVINAVASFLVSASLVFLIDDFNYFLVTTICGIVQFLLVIISIFMIIYRHDLRGVHDLVSGTQVIKEG